LPRTNRDCAAAVDEGASFVDIGGKRWSLRPKGAIAVRQGCGLPPSGIDRADQIPRLAKQRVDYLIPALNELRDGRRPGADTLMSQVVAGLSDADLTALANFAASR
jgi:cytochrome c553